ncbi:ASKHA domain-containing protein [Desulfurobacterium thermolithotrophum]|uniref:ASKHA domain-containing protein n=1 Tax=Desulfurobacterium thermolithotrophum TaxID=64160 RepID=UPI0013D5AA60|nr:ASKHA domain-containing protein [Desulfurobacterium thermolithotrophum]
MKLFVEVPEGKSLYQILREKGFMKSAYCGGRGTCRKCTVKINGKEKLACLTFGPYKGEVEVFEERLVLQGETLPSIQVDCPKTGFGVALDLGTTGVEGAFFDLFTGKFLKSYKTLNFQSSFGADVVTRVELARKNYKKQRELLLETVSFLLKQFGKSILEVVVVSNPVMHHFLLGLPVSGFEKYPFKLEVEEDVYISGKELGISDFPNTFFYFPPPFKNFVGSDFLSNLLYFESQGFENFGIADLGTNAELGIYKKNLKVAASVPAGPAFEGVGLFSGMRATKGAIYKVFFDGRTFKYFVIGNEKPQGICASGYFDIIYLLKSFRIINKEGTFEKNLNPLIANYIREVEGQKAFVLYEDKENLIAITQEDIRKFLLAKASVYGGLSALIEKADVPDKFFFSGAFGSHIDKRSIKGVKLIPENLPEVKAFGNAALKGAAFLLGSKKKRERIKELKREVEFLELATNKTFETKYIEGMEL